MNTTSTPALQPAIAPVPVTMTLINGVLYTSAPEPRIGQPLTPEQSVALGMANTAKYQGIKVVHNPQEVPLIALAADILDPEMYGHAVTPEVRRAASKALGRHARTAADNETSN